MVKYSFTKIKMIILGYFKGVPPYNFNANALQKIPYHPLLHIFISITTLTLAQINLVGYKGRWSKISKH